MVKCREEKRLLNNTIMGEEQPPKNWRIEIMALTRAMLKGMNLTEEQVSAIIDAHTETVDGLKEQLKQFKTDAEKLPEVQRELEKAQKDLEKSGDAAKIQKDFDDYKAEVQAKETRVKKEAALRKVAKDAGLTDAGIAKAVKYSDYTAIELDDKDEIKEPKNLIKSLREEWPEHLVKENTKGADTPTPPGGNGGNGSKGNPRAAEVYKEYHAALYGQPQQQNNNQTGNNGQEGANQS